MNIRISPFSFGRGLLFGPQKIIGCLIGAVVIVVVAVFVIGAAVFFNFKHHQHLLKLTGEARAQVLNVKVTSNKPERSSRTYVTRIFYKFDVDGRTIETDFVKPGDVSEDIEVGRPAKVCYDQPTPTTTKSFKCAIAAASRIGAVA
jgi:uncharacterized protein DUF3592